MVLTRRTGLETVRSVVVPDSEHWTMGGIDVASLGYVRADGPEHAELLLVPDRIPEALEDAVLDAWSRLPEPRRFLPLDADFGGVPAGVLLGGDGGGASPRAPADGGAGSHDHGDRGGSEEDHDVAEHGGHGTEAHDHHDMMAIVGEPSADGLVMESIDLELGPLSSALPGGLMAEISLDGDVVDHCTLRATLTATPPGRDALAAGPGATAALEAAIARARERAAGAPAPESVERRRVAALELERALGHAGWLRSFGTVLGWAELADRAQAVVDVLLEPRRLTARLAGAGGRGPDWSPEWREALPGAAKAVEALVSLAHGRRLRSRTAGQAGTPAAEVSGGAIGGPVARAAGVIRDARLGDPLYEELGFEVEREDTGDAVARARVRAREMRGAVTIAAAAASEEGAPEPPPPAHPDGAVTVEGSRGPLRVTAGARQGSAPELTARGAPETLELAGRSVRGLELAAALTGIASFDLSPWKVDR